MVDVCVYDYSMGLRLREHRERRGLSIRGLADEAGVSFPTVWRIEASRLSPTVAMLETLADALGIAVRDFFPAAPRRRGRQPARWGGRN
jgi:transcriptional regulator with XRE-family HTH domain